MSKNASLATGEAMPSLNRRRMLLGLAAATSGAAVLAATAANEARADAPTETANLLRLADDLSAAVAEFDAALVRLRTARTVAEAIWPVADDALTEDWPDWERYERDVTGRAIDRPGEKRPRTLVTVAQLETQLQATDKHLNRKRAKHPLSPERLMAAEADRALLIERLASARDYEARKDHARKASGYSDASARYNTAEEALVATVRNVMAEPAKSLTGVVIKAEALQAWAKVPLLPRTLATLKDDWTASFAGELLAIAGA